MLKHIVFLAVFALMLPAFPSSSHALQDPDEFCRFLGYGNNHTNMKDCVFHPWGLINTYYPQITYKIGNVERQASTETILANGGWKIKTKLPEPNSDPTYYQKAFQSTRLRVTDPLSAERAMENIAKHGNILFFNPAYPLSEEPSVQTSMKGYEAVRVNAMPTGKLSLIPIDAYGICRYVDNYSGVDIFVPLKSRQEWKSFADNPPESVIVKKCALPCNGHCAANGLYYGKTSVHRKDFGDDGNSVEENINKQVNRRLPRKYFPPMLPYARSGEPWPSQEGKDAGLDTHTFNFYCTSKRVSKPVCFDHPDLVKYKWELCYDHRCHYEDGTKCTQPTCTAADGSTMQQGETMYVPGYGQYKGKYSYKKLDCKNWGTICITDKHPWTEKWELNGLRAGESEDVSDENYMNGNFNREKNGWEWDGLHNNGEVSGQIAHIVGQPIQKRPDALCEVGKALRQVEYSVPDNKGQKVIKCEDGPLGPDETPFIPSPPGSCSW